MWPNGDYISLNEVDSETIILMGTWVRWVRCGTCTGTGFSPILDISHHDLLGLPITRIQVRGMESCDCCQVAGYHWDFRRNLN